MGQNPCPVNHITWEEKKKKEEEEEAQQYRC